MASSSEPTLSTLEFCEIRILHVLRGLLCSLSTVTYIYTYIQRELIFAIVWNFLLTSFMQVPQIRDTLYQLRERDMLPAIWFIFSRRGCDLAVHYLLVIYIHLACLTAL